jgi:deoxyhypusine synthase
MEIEREEINAVRIGKNMSVDQLMRGLRGCAFGAGRLAAAVDIYEEMLKKDVTKFLGLAGALVPAGMRNVIAEMVRERYVDVVVTTGANIVHDIIEALGEHHYKIENKIGLLSNNSTVIDDIWLKKHEMSRIYDVVIYDDAFVKLEDYIRGVFENLDCKSKTKTYTINELLRAIGETISDKNSILRSAVDSEVPVFCPAIADSMIGLHAWMYKQVSPLEVDAFGDMKTLIDICYHAKDTGIGSGAIILGGGVPKNFIFQAMLITPQEGFDYALQITTESPQTGGLSGATLEEAKSWGKIGEKAKTVTVYCDVTIALPIIMAALRARMERGDIEKCKVQKSK